MYQTQIRAVYHPKPKLTPGAVQIILANANKKLNIQILQGSVARKWCLNQKKCFLLMFYLLCLFVCFFVFRVTVVHVSDRPTGPSFVSSS